MNEIFEQKVSTIKKIFQPLSLEERYAALIELGRKLPPFPHEYKTEQFLVRGCQSALYLHADYRAGKIYFTAHADALISAGLAAILIMAYSEQPPEIILTCPPDFLTELGIAASLSPNRSNGLAHIHLRMKQEALKALLKK